MALTVKSRRSRSSSMDVTNSTWSGRRPSEYPPSPRSVVTSKASLPIITVTVPCSIPVGMVRRNRSRTCSGRALVARSQSLTSRPRSRSRMQPPTTQAR
jgi:hypothetical protein